MLHFCFDLGQGMLLGVIHKGVESGEILAQPPLGGAGRPEEQNLGALVASCGSLAMGVLLADHFPSSVCFFRMDPPFS